MVRTQISQSQADDEDFSFQAELEKVSDNNEGGFDATLMNNVALYNMLSQGSPNAPLRAESAFNSSQESLNSYNWTDIPGTEMSITTVGAGKLLALFTSTMTSSSSGGGTEFEFRVIVADEIGQTEIAESYNGLERSFPTFYLTNEIKPVGNYTARVQWRIVSGNSTIYAENSHLLLMSLASTKGDKGDPGAGTTISLQNNGIPLSGEYHTINIAEGLDVDTDIENGIATISTSKFGSGYHNASSTGVSSTTSYYYTNKIDMSFNVPAGNYRIGWYYEWSSSSSKYDFLGRITIDGYPIVDHRQEAAESYNQSMPASGFVYRNLNGSHNLKLQYCSENYNLAIIKNAHLEIWRIS